MSTAIQKYEGTRTARAFNWAALSDEDLRREAITAANERDTTRLWDLSEAHLILHGGRGSRVSPHTVDNYQRGITALLRHWQGENLIRPGRDAPLRYVRELEDAGLSAGTIQVRLAAARLLYRALRWAGATDAAPFADVKAPHDPTPAEEKRQAYPEAAVTALVEAADTQDRALVLLAAHGGLRVAEILSLTWPAIDLAGGTLRVTGKGSKTRTVHLSAALVDSLRAWQVESEGEHVIPYRTATRARQRLQELCRQAGVTYLGVHSLRHSCGTHLHRLAGDLRVVARHLGHANTSTTQIYAKMDTTAYSAAVAKF